MYSLYMSFVSLQASKTKLRKGSSSTPTAMLCTKSLNYSNYQYISITKFLEVGLRIVKELASTHCKTDSMHCDRQYAF
jgi:hypothetical protein